MVRWIGLRLRRAPVVAAAAALAAMAAGGCAKSPGGTNLGPRLIVTLRFRDPVNPTYRYYFLIRNADDIADKNYPIPVIAPPYGNGIATSAHNGITPKGFTDFVLYTAAQPSSSGYLLYHVNPSVLNAPDNPTSFMPGPEPVNPVPPQTSDPHLLQFELPISYLQPPSSECDPNTPPGCPQGSILQINIVATTKLPADPNSNDPQKFTDAIGDQTQGSATFNSFVHVDTRTATVYQSSTVPSDPAYEPDFNDTYPAPSDPAIDMLAWRIEVRR